MIVSACPQRNTQLALFFFFSSSQTHAPPSRGLVAYVLEAAAGHSRDYDNTGHMAMFGFGKGTKHEEAKGERKKDDKGPVKRVFGVPLETLTLVEAKCFDNDVLFVPVVVRDTIEWLRANKGARLIVLY